MEDLDNIIEEDADEYFDSTDFENDNINKRFSNKNEKERKQKEKRANKKKEKEKTYPRFLFDPAAFDHGRSTDRAVSRQ